MATYNKLINVPVTISASTAGGVTTHTWLIDGVSQAEITSSITRTYTTVGTHIIRHEGSNSCGLCATPVEHTLIIGETLPSGGGGTAIMIMAAAAIGLMMMAKGK